MVKKDVESFLCQLHPVEKCHSCFLFARRKHEWQIILLFMVGCAEGGLFHQYFVSFDDVDAFFQPIQGL